MYGVIVSKPIFIACFNTCWLYGMDSGVGRGGHVGDLQFDYMMIKSFNVALFGI